MDSRGIFQPEPEGQAGVDCGRTLFTPETRHLSAQVFAGLRRLKASRPSIVRRVPTAAEQTEYNIRKRHGFYDDINDLMGYDLSSWEIRKTACTASPFVVGLCRCTEGDRPLTSSGIVFDFYGVKKILTSAYILGGDTISFINTNVDVLLVNRKRVVGSICFMDQYYNFVVIDLPDDPQLRAAKFDSTSFELGTGVTALSRHSSGQLRASSGQINIRNDHLPSDELMSSSCSISECGIGGPLIGTSSGLVIGMNFFSKRSFTPFMPSNILFHCMERLKHRGVVTCPFLGLKVRSLNESKVDELELLFNKFSSHTGLAVREVVKGSPADESDICSGDVIVSCNNIPVNSPHELADILFGMVKLSNRGRVIISTTERRSNLIKVVIQRMSTGTEETKIIVVRVYTPLVINRWPLLPPPLAPPPV